MNISWINHTNTDIYVQTQDNRQMELGFNKSNLNLTWNVDSFKNDSMTINLLFNNPLEISSNLELDKLVISFKKSLSLITFLQNNNET